LPLRTFLEILGMPVVVLQREAGDFFQVLRSQKGILPVEWPGSQCADGGTKLVAHENAVLAAA